MYNILAVAIRTTRNKSQILQYTSSGKLDYKEQKPNVQYTRSGKSDYKEKKSKCTV